MVLFEKGAVEWDEDLVVNGRAALETLVRVGMGIGRCRRVAITVHRFTDREKGTGSES